MKKMEIRERVFDDNPRVELQINLTETQDRISVDEFMKMVNDAKDKLVEHGGEDICVDFGGDDFYFELTCYRAVTDDDIKNKKIRRLKNEIHSLEHVADALRVASRKLEELELKLAELES